MKALNSWLALPTTPIQRLHRHNLARQTSRSRCLVLVWATTETPQVTKQAKEQGYWPKMGIITLGSGFATTFYLNETGADNADGIIVTQDLHR